MTETATAPLRSSRRGVLLAVHVQPGARSDGAKGVHDGRLRVSVTSPAEGGKANARVVEVVASLLGLKRADVELVSGATSRRKELALHGLDVEEAARRLAPILAAAEP